uniref:FXYD domain-containing ion transport regulator n=1 Tax=Strongyloides venezuelensis TaxID=75913 RepID=A0A0K0F417_STRVS
MLVWTGMYKSKDEIPEYLTSGTMSKLSDRYRAFFIVVGCIGFFVFALLGEKNTAARVERDKKVGVFVTKIGMLCRVAKCPMSHLEGNHGEEHHGFVKAPGVPALNWILH